MKIKSANSELEYEIHELENKISEQNNEDALKRRVEELAAITTLTREVTSKLSMKQMITSTHRQIHSTVSPDLTVIYLKQGDKLVKIQEWHQRQHCHSK